MEFRYLSQEDVQNLNLPMLTIIEALEEMFVEKGNSRVEMPPKPGIHTKKDAFIHAMPAYIPKLNSCGMKWVSGYPENQKKGLPYITGLMILNDPETGIPLCVMDAVWVTAMRTGAATALAAKYMARKDSSTVGILAAGVQGRSNLEALNCLFDIKKVKVFDIVSEVAEKFQEEMSSRFQLEIEIVKTPKEAVIDMDLVVTSGPILKDPSPIIEGGWLAPGSFASPVDFDSYWTGDALKEADKLATDDIDQMEYYRGAGYFSDTPKPYADLGEIIAGKKSGRDNSEQRTICINLGIALDDMAVAPHILKLAIERGVGTSLKL